MASIHLSAKSPQATDQKGFNWTQRSTHEWRREYSRARSSAWHGKSSRLPLKTAFDAPHSPEQSDEEQHSESRRAAAIHSKNLAGDVGSVEHQETYRAGNILR